MNTQPSDPGAVAQLAPSCIHNAGAIAQLAPSCISLTKLAFATTGDPEKKLRQSDVAKGELRIRCCCVFGVG